MTLIDKDFLSNVRWQGSGNILAQLINIATLPIVTRYFSPADLGLLNVFVQALAFLTILISFRVEHIIILPKRDSHARELTSFVYGFGILSSLATLIIIIFLIYFGLIPAPYHLWAPLLPIVAFLTVFSQAAQQLSQRSGVFKLSGISEVLNRALNSLFSIVSGLLNGPGLLLSVAVGVGLFFKISTFWHLYKYLNKSIWSSWTQGARRIRELALERILVSLIASHGLLAITSLAPLWYISREWGDEYVGYYTLVIATLALPTRLIGVAVGQVFYQRAAEIFSGHENFNQLLVKSAFALLGVAIPCFSIIFLFGDVLYPFIFGDQWSPAGLVSQYYVFAAMLSFLSVPFDRAGLIVNAWWYGPTWHSLRLLTTFLTIYLSKVLFFSFYEFIILITIQSSLMYVIDLVASYIFSLRISPYSHNRSY